MLCSRFCPAPPRYLSFTSPVLGLHNQRGASILMHSSLPGTALSLDHPVYLNSVSPISYDDLVRQLSPPPILLRLGDFNLRCPLLGDKVTSPHAHLLSSLLPVFSLRCLNYNLPTHYHCQTSYVSCTYIFLFFLIIPFPLLGSPPIQTR